MSEVIEFPDNTETRIREMTGCILPGTSVFIEGRLVPNMTMIDRGETIEFCLDHRLMFIFPREAAVAAATFAAHAMAIGAGHPSLSAPHASGKAYGTPVIGLSAIPE